MVPPWIVDICSNRMRQIVKILFAGYTLDLQLHLLSTLEVFTIDQELFALFLLQLGHFHVASINFTQ